MIPARGPQTGFFCAIGSCAWIPQRAFQQALRAKHLLTKSVFQFGSCAEVPSLDASLEPICGTLGSFWAAWVPNWSHFGNRVGGGGGGEGVWAWARPEIK